MTFNSVSTTLLSEIQDMFQSEMSSADLGHLNTILFGLNENLFPQNEATDIEDVKQNVITVERKLESINLFRSQAAENLKKRRESLKLVIDELIRQAKLLGELDENILQRGEIFRTLSQLLEIRRREIMADDSLSAEEKARLLDALTAEISQLQYDHRANMFSIEKDKMELVSASKDLLMTLQRLEQTGQQIASSSEEGPNMFSDDFGDFYLNELGLKIYVQKYMRDEFGRYFIDTYGNKIYKKNYDDPEYMLVDGRMVMIERSSSDGRPRVVLNTENNEKLDFIAKHLAKPLKMGLAAIIVEQPSDAIDYLANYLLNYRYNEIRRMVDEKLIQRATE